MQHDARSKQQYARLRAAGHSHGRALRGVADRLLAILIAMLKTGQPYDPQASCGDCCGESRRLILAGYETVGMIGRPKPPPPFRRLSRRSGRIPAEPYPSLKCLYCSRAKTTILAGKR